jgi:myotubularin-related protein 9
MKFYFIGTFIFNNEKEKMKYNGTKKTVSLWSYFNRPEILRTFLNPFYEPNINVLWPSVAAQSIVSQCLAILFLVK